MLKKILEQFDEEFNDMFSYIEFQTGTSERKRAKNFLRAALISIAQEAVKSRREKRKKTEKEIGLECLRYCRHRWEKHPNSGIHKCLTIEDFKTISEKSHLL